jgi:hypothetical protein
VTLVPLGALADPQQQAAERLADRLFQEATQLEDTGNYAAACPRLEQSNALDPAIGTQFNLADCYEHTGFLARAFMLFRSVEGIAKAAGKEQRELSARERADALEARVPRLRLELAPGANVPGLQVRRDDAAIAPEDLHSRLLLDPGMHVVSASAPGHVSWSTSVQATSGTQVSVVIPRLAENAALPGEAPREAQGSSRSGPPAAAIVSGVLGLAGLALGGIAGGISWADHNSASQACPAPQRCPTSAGAGQWNDAVTWGNVSTVAFAVGGVGIVAATVLWVSAPSPHAVASAGFGLRGAF